MITVLSETSTSQQTEKKNQTRKSLDLISKLNYKATSTFIFKFTPSAQVGTWNYHCCYTLKWSLCPYIGIFWSDQSDNTVHAKCHHMN